jgi:hypothetical protein
MTTEPTQYFTIALDACEPDELPAQCAQYGVGFILLNEDGPARWPEYRYVGTRDQLTAFLGDIYDDDANDPGDKLVDHLVPLGVNDNELTGDQDPSWKTL